MKTRLMKRKINYQINPFIRIDSDNKKMSIYNVPKRIITTLTILKRIAHLSTIRL